jgi:Rrf2 family iron-sulfur cluster assembly transcriptional regulator
MAYVVHKSADGPVLAKDIASTMNVPLQYLHKILRELVRSGVLTSARGVGGGFRLGRAPADITLAEVVGPFEDLFERTTCPFGNEQCGMSDPCPLHDQWKEVVTKYKHFLATTSLEQLGNLPDKASWVSFDT